MRIHSHSRAPAPSLVSALLLASACQQPLPTESPQTQVADPAPPVAIEVDSTQDPEPAPPTEQAAPAAKTVFKGIGLQTPECVLHHAAADTYLVSNINGKPDAIDNNGFISILKPDGGVQNLTFIEGGKNGVELNAPKGLLRIEQSLYVADVDHLRKFDLSTGAALGAWHFPRATFLNALATDGKGAIYVTDSGRKSGQDGLEPNGTDALYKLQNEEITTLAEGPEMKGPNGVAIQDGQILVVTLGSNLLTQYNPLGKVVKQVQLPGGGLDGLIAMADGTVLISSWGAQSVYSGSFTTPFSTVVTGATAPAAIGFDSKRQRVLVPLFTQNEVWAVPMANADSTAAAPPPPNSQAAPSAPDGAGPPN